MVLATTLVLQSKFVLTIVGVVCSIYHKLDHTMAPVSNEGSNIRDVLFAG